jgi:hypothetical protein
MLTGTSEAVLWLNGIHNESLGEFGTSFFGPLGLGFEI